MTAVTTLAADKLRKASINSEPMRDPVAQREVASPDGTREAVDPVLERLDPDSGRPPNVMEANQLCLSFRGQARADGRQRALHPGFDHRPDRADRIGQVDAAPDASTG